ncbi:MAG: hypothetical protein KC736_01375 [Candidatus Moranbacteria bacterium]|nr:hypothetical protein [Candidatus Moranbacteria bacterium]
MQVVVTVFCVKTFSDGRQCKEGIGNVITSSSEPSVRDAPSNTELHYDVVDTVFCSLRGEAVPRPLAQGRRKKVKPGSDDSERCACCGEACSD